MEFRVDFVDGQYADFSRQECIGSPEYGFPFHRSDRLDTGDLSVCMDPRVGTAGTEDIHIVIEQLLKSFRQLALNCTEIGLDLPSMEIGAVICKSQLEVPHSIGYSM